MTCGQKNRSGLPLQVNKSRRVEIVLGTGDGWAPINCRRWQTSVQPHEPITDQLLTHTVQPVMDVACESALRMVHVML